MIQPGARPSDHPRCAECCLVSCITETDKCPSFSWFDPPIRQIYFPQTDDSDCDGIQSSLTSVHCFDDAYVGEQPVACKEYFALEV